MIVFFKNFSNLLVIVSNPAINKDMTFDEIFHILLISFTKFLYSIIFPFFLHVTFTTSDTVISIMLLSSEVLSKIPISGRLVWIS